MSSILARLDRPVPGRVRTRDAAAVRVRPTGRVADPTPNAPLLVRIVRHPYGLHTGHPARRVRYRPEDEAPEDFDRHAILAAALADRREPWSSFASRARPRPFVVRPSRWTLLAPPEDR